MLKKRKKTQEIVLQRAYSDPSLKRAALAKKICAFCGGSFAKHRGDKCFCELDCTCDRFMKRDGDAL